MRTATTAALLTGVALAVGVAPAFAAPSGGPTGSIELEAASLRTADASTGPQYNSTVGFATTVEGRISSQARTYVTVICWQGDNVVYQYSAAPDFDFPLVDQAGQGLEWDGGAASCDASLIYRVEKGRSAEITVLDAVLFDVGAATV